MATEQTLISATGEDIEAVFTEWDRRYREDPEAFMNEVTHLLGHTPESYGELCRVYFISLLDEHFQQHADTEST